MSDKVVKRIKIGILILAILFLVAGIWYQLDSRPGKKQEARVALTTDEVRQKDLEIQELKTRLKDCEGTAAKNKTVAKQQVLEQTVSVAKQATPPAPPVVPVVPVAPTLPAVAPLVVETQPAPLSAPERVIAIPASAPAAPFVVRIVVVEWSDIFKNRSLEPRDIGPVVNEGLRKGTVHRAKGPHVLKVNGWDVTVENGDAIISPEPLTAKAVLKIRPMDGAKFASPQNGQEIRTNPGDLYASKNRGAREFWITLILAPYTPPAMPAAPTGGSQGVASRPNFCF